MLRIGLTGGIACGKSTVLRRLRAHGLDALELDPLAHELMAPGRPAHAEVVEAFGSGIQRPDGSIDRAALGALVFSSPALRQRLNQIVHPRVRAEEAARARALEARPGAALVTDAALLVETGFHLRFDRLVVVHCRPEQQVARLRRRDGLSEEEALARVRSQMPAETKRLFGHFAVDSSGSLPATEEAADRLAPVLLALASRPRRPCPMPAARALGALVHGPSRGARGLTPLALAQHLAGRSEIDLPSLAGRLVPPATGPWYEAAPEGADRREGGPPAALMAPLAIHELAGNGHDPERLASLAHSVAWLTTPEHHGGRLSEAVFMAVALGQTLATGRVDEGLEQESHPAQALARRWGGAAPGPDLAAAVSAALRWPRDPQSAREACAASGGAEPGLAGALVGAATGPGTGEEASSAAAVWGGFLDGLPALSA